MSLKVDILSDLHIDFYFKKDIPITKEDVKKLYDPIFGGIASDVLIVAGDIGHYNEQNIKVLQFIQELYYGYIVCVLGNHDYYLSSKAMNEQYQDSFHRAKELKDELNSSNNIYCLDGNIIEIEGIKFGGAMGWYSDAYLKAYYPLRHFSQKSNNTMWKTISQDSMFIKGIENFDDLYHIEYPKLLEVYEKCDIMITHINPSFLDKHLDLRFTSSQSNTFFTFNGHNLLDKGSMKYWVFGHTHTKIEYEFEDVKCICNPLGYPGESNYREWCSIKTIEI